MTTNRPIAVDRLEAPAFKGPLPPYRCIRDFLKTDERNDLLEFSIANAGRFKPADILEGGIAKINPQRRASVSLRDFRPAKDLLRARLTALFPKLIAELRVTSFVPAKLELELVAHGDGAFFSRHIDTVTGADAKGRSTRMISAVYYFYSEPKAFAGGSLRLYRFGRVEGDDDFIDIQPQQNALVVFPSWVTHEVLPISCPSRRFADSRFAVNCWVHAAPKGK
jgi:SM-20-related protein